MSSSDETYTYRGGQKLPLSKSSIEFVVRATPERLRDAGITAWRLHVADLEARDVGTLNRWGLQIEREA